MLGAWWGARGPLMGAIRADYFGVKAIGTIMGLSSLIVTIGNVFGPVFAGWMWDVRGDYQLGFIILAAMTGVGTVFFIAAKRPSRPESTWARGRRLVMQRRARERMSSGDGAQD
ncbi:MAG: MFS transporter [Chloroflexota bacterium]|nr:MFS transporter [Chloroflexota bacterium]